MAERERAAGLSSKLLERPGFTVALWSCSAHRSYVGRKLIQEPICALYSSLGSIFSVQKESLLGIGQFSCGGCVLELNAGKRNGKQLPSYMHIKRIDQAYIRVDEVKTRGVDCFRAVCEPAMRKFLSVYS